VQSQGSVAQVGTPMQLYHRPANLFVAQFIGSPKMNVLPGRLLSAEAGHAVVQVLGVPVTVAVDARGLAPGAEVSLGMRPEHVLVDDAGQGDGFASLTAQVSDVERLGEASMLYLRAGADAGAAAEVPMAVRLEGYASQAIGQAVTLRLRPEHGHLFDADGRACPRTTALPG
jgi:multiple sugar transport system ATP-binding protein